MDKRYWNEKLRPYTEKSNFIAFGQVLITLIPFVLLWYGYILTLNKSAWLVLPFALIISLFILRFFVLLHDCGHGSLFRSNRLNKIVGYFLGVITGMPQFVWSKHHAYHHTTNGNWEKYHGPLNIISTADYATLTEKQKRNYKLFRHPGLILIAGFYYVLFNPRFTWIMGSLHWFKNILSSFFTKQKTKDVISACESKYWKTPKEYLHMTYNNVLLLSIWYVMVNLIGGYNFFSLYALSLSLSGGLGILFFTVQHNFENSYASDTAGTDYFQAAIKGTSFLKLPMFLNWFTADIAYHHIHHLSTSVPNYRLASCQRDLQDLFGEVQRIHLRDIPKALDCILWDKEREIIIPINDLKSAKGSM